MKKFKKSKHWFAFGLAALLLVAGVATVQAKGKIIHDAEHYVLEAQHGEKWAKEDEDLDKRLAELEKKLYEGDFSAKEQNIVIYHSYGVKKIR